MDLLEKIENAISSVEEKLGQEVSINLNYGELRLIRRYLKLDEYNTELSAENLKKGMLLRKREKSQTKAISK